MSKVCRYLNVETMVKILHTTLFLYVFHILPRVFAFSFLFISLFLPSSLSNMGPFFLFISFFIFTEYHAYTFIEVNIIIMFSISILHSTLTTKGVCD